MIRFVLCLWSVAFISFLFFSIFFPLFIVLVSVWPILLHRQTSECTEQLPSNVVQFILVESYLYDLCTFIFNRFAVPFLSRKNRIACIGSQPAWVVHSKTNHLEKSFAVARYELVTCAPCVCQLIRCWIKFIAFNWIASTSAFERYSTVDAGTRWHIIIQALMKLYRIL